MNDGFTKYDAVVKDLFQKDHPSLLDQLTGGIKIKAFLNVDLAKILERHADLVLLLEDGTILHIEFQHQRQGHAVPYRNLLCSAWSQVPLPRPAGGFVHRTR